MTLINDGTGVTAIDVNGDAAATATTPTVATNRLLNEQSGLSGIQFVGGGGGNLLDNEADGVASITLTSYGSNNVLSNSGNNFGQITLNGDGADSTLFNYGSDVGTSADVSSITFDENGGTDALINTGSGLADIVMSGSDLASGLANSGRTSARFPSRAGLRSASCSPTARSARWLFNPPHRVRSRSSTGEWCTHSASPVPPAPIISRTTAPSRSLITLAAVARTRWSMSARSRARRAPARTKARSRPPARP